MLCILAFIIFLLLYPILGIFSKDYRDLFKKSWSCVFKKVTFKPCDISLGEEIKSKLLGKIIFKYPRFAKLIDKSFSFLAFIFVVLSVWSLLYMVVAGVNLVVYDTCNPRDVESCSLGGASCGVDQQSLTLVEAVNQRQLGEYLAAPFTDFYEAVTLIPDRFKNWEANDYLAQNPSYYNFIEGNPTAIEAVDPGCISCANLFKNIKQTDFTDNYNLTYLLYPIPDEANSTGTRFFNSMTIAKYVEATKDVELENAEVPGDWQILAKIWENAADANSLQKQFNNQFSLQEAEARLQEILLEIGYSQDQVGQISELAASEEIETRLANQKRIVEDEIRTIKIPTIIFNGRRYNRVLEPEQLK
jgi:hypothetical protein